MKSEVPGSILTRLFDQKVLNQNDLNHLNLLILIQKLSGGGGRKLRNFRSAIFL